MNPTRAILSAVVFSLLAGCAVFSSGPSTYTISFKGEPSLNKNEEGKDTDVTVRIYLLKGDREFTNADLASLWEKDKQVLDGSLVKRCDDVLVTVGMDTKEVQIQVPPEATYVGLVGLFNEAKGTSWRVCVPVDQIDDQVWVCRDYSIGKK